MAKARLFTLDPVLVALFGRGRAAAAQTGSTAQHAGVSPGVEAGPSFWDLVREDLGIQHGDWTRPGFQAMLMYRIGNVRCRSRLERALISRLYRTAHILVRNLYTIEIHASAKLGRRIKVAHQGSIVIHEHAVIGADCIIRQGVTIGGGSDANYHRGPVLGADVELGAGAVVVGGVHIGDRVKIGPNAVVMSDVPAGSIVVAQPPRIIPGRRP